MIVVFLRPLYHFDRFLRCCDLLSYANLATSYLCIRRNVVSKPKINNQKRHWKCLDRSLYSFESALDLKLQSPMLSLCIWSYQRLEQYISARRHRIRRSERERSGMF